MFITISILIFLMIAMFIGKKKQNGEAFGLEMSETIWMKIQKLNDVEEYNEQNIQEQKTEEKQENENLNLEVLERGDESQQHAYQYYWDFPFLEMEFADKICKDKFAQLLKNEITVTVPETGEECYLEEFELVIEKYNDKPYDLERYYFYLFDVDGNDAPELCLFDLLSTDIIDSMCIFKYDFDLDKIILWEYFQSHYTLLFGTNSFASENGNANEYYFHQVDENAEPVFRTGFVWEGFFTNGNVVYMIVLPQYIGGTRRDSQIEQMKEKAFYEKETGISYLRVTKEQCEELSEYYFRAREKAAEELKKLKKNYWELFG